MISAMGFRQETMSALLGTMIVAVSCSDDSGSADAGLPVPTSGIGTGVAATTEADLDGTGAGSTTPNATGTTNGAVDDTAEPSTGDDTTGRPPANRCGTPAVWCPDPGTTWQWQLSGALDTSLEVAMYDIDLFDTEADQISALQAQGRVVICYFSAGSHEQWRPDAADFPASAIGDPLDDWPGERWLDIRDATVRTLLAARLDLAEQKGCDGVEPDNVDGYTNGTGFALTADDQLDFNQWLADQSHQRALSVGLKNDVDQVTALLPYFDWALNEECMAYDECDTLAPFIDAGKAVFHVEYVDDPAQGPGAAATVCPDALSRSFSSLVKHWDLDAWGIVCE